MKIKILYADDEAHYRRLVKMFLEESGYSVVTAENGQEALEIIHDDKDIQLVILDVMMPVMDGWVTCKAIRKISHVPILMLTALDDVNSEVFGLENGADDYISKPFSHELFIARVKGLLRRLQTIEEDQLSGEHFKLDETNNSVIINEEEIPLRPKEFELLKALLLNKNKVLSRDQILNLVWGFDYYGDRRTVDTHIKSLRSKMGDLGEQIVTLRGKGYCYRGEES